MALTVSLFPTKYVIYALYIIVPVFLFKYTFEHLPNNVIFFIYFIAIIICGQSSYLLKMSISQLVILYFVFSKRRKILGILGVLFHLQAFPVASLLTIRMRRIYYLSMLLYAANWLISTDSLSFGTDILDSYKSGEQDKFDYNKISLILISLYILFSTILKVDRQRDTFLIRLIDTTIIASLLFIGNPIIFNRAIEFSWLFILIYIFTKFSYLNVYGKLLVHAALLVCTVLSTKFFMYSIIGF